MCLEIDVTLNPFRKRSSSSSYYYRTKKCQPLFVLERDLFGFIIVVAVVIVFFWLLFLLLLVAVGNFVARIEWSGGGVVVHFLPLATNNPGWPKKCRGGAILGQSSCHK